jgi:hypothetical protein
MREDRRDRARVPSGRLCPPRARIQPLQDDLVHPVVYGIRFQQRLQAFMDEQVYPNELRELRFEQEVQKNRWSPRSPNFSPASPLTFRD